MRRNLEKGKASVCSLMRLATRRRDERHRPILAHLHDGAVERLTSRLARRESISPDNICHRQRQEGVSPVRWHAPRRRRPDVPAKIGTQSTASRRADEVRGGRRHGASTGGFLSTTLIGRAADGDHYTERNRYVTHGFAAEVLLFQ